MLRVSLIAIMAFLPAGMSATPMAYADLFPKTQAEVLKVADDAKKASLDSLNMLYEVGQRTFDNTCRVFDIARSKFGTVESILQVVEQTAIQSDVRDSASEAQVQLKKLEIDLFQSNRKLFRAFSEYSQKAECEGLSTQKQYWLSETMLDFKREGLELPDDIFAQVVDIRKGLSQLQVDFEKNISDDSSSVTLAESELEGVPASIVAQLSKTSDGLLIAKMDYPTYFGVMKNCVVASTRQKMAEAFQNRAFPKNMAILHSVVEQRYKLAKLLGFPSYAHFQLSSNMVKAPSTAHKFVEDLIPQLQKKWDSERQILASGNLHPSIVTKNGEVFDYDIPFAINEYKKQHLNVNETAIQEYFPLNSTIDALFSIFEAFFDIEFEKLAPALWHKDVTALRVHDRKSHTVLGDVILDLFPRDGKYSHACCHGVIPPTVQQNGGGFSPALAVVVANFPKSTETKPALFLHDDVQTFFHEFGHAIHFLMGRTEMATVAGFNVKGDFVELPSQMLEEWLWESDILQRVTKHYQTGAALPPELINAKVRSKNAFRGRDSLRQLQFASLSLSIFEAKFAENTADKMNSDALFMDLQSAVMPGIVYNANGHMQCNFGHLMGYGASYYGYMWSEVFAHDVFEFIRERNGLLSSALGRQYVEHIIGRGGSADPNELLREFLGREPNNHAFLKRMGISS